MAPREHGSMSLWCHGTMIPSPFPLQDKSKLSDDPGRRRPQQFGMGRGGGSGGRSGRGQSSSDVQTFNLMKLFTSVVYIDALGLQTVHWISFAIPSAAALKALVQFVGAKGIVELGAHNGSLGGQWIERHSIIFATQ